MILSLNLGVVSKSLPYDLNTNISRCRTFHLSFKGQQTRLSKCYWVICQTAVWRRLQPCFSPLFCMKLWLLPSLSTLPNYILCFPAPLPPPHFHFGSFCLCWSSHLDFLSSLYPKSLQPAKFCLRSLPTLWGLSQSSNFMLASLSSHVYGLVVSTFILPYLLTWSHINSLVRLVLLDEKNDSLWSYGQWHWCLNS